MGQTKKVDQIVSQRLKINHLIISVVLDLLGMASYLIPVVAEFTDLIFAPLYGISIFLIYKRRKLPAAIGGLAGVLEELLPGMDFVPSATFMWLYTYILKRERE